MGIPKLRRSCRKTRSKKKGYFQKGHQYYKPNYKDIDLPNELPVQRLSQSEAEDVRHLTLNNQTDCNTLPYKLRPKPETEENGNYGELDENIIVNLHCLGNLVSKVHKQHCANASTRISITQRHGLCVVLSVECLSCHFRSEPVEMSSRIKGKRGPGAGQLNEMLVLPVLKSRVGIADVSLMLSCLNIKPPSEAILQKKLNRASATAEEISEQQIINNQTYVNKVLALSGRLDGADVQTDNAFPCRPQGGAEKSKQSFSAVIEHSTSKCLVLAQSTANKFCRLPNCTHESCSKNYPTQDSIAATERTLLQKNLNKIHRGARVKIRSVTTDASSQLAKAMREYKQNNQVSMKHYNCYIHKLRTLEKNIRAIKLQSKLPANQEKSPYIKTLAAAIRTRVRMEFNNAKMIKYDENDFLAKCTLALENIIPCFNNNHSMCRRKSTVCQHYMADLGKYNTKHLPYGNHIKLNKPDLKNLKSVICNTFDVQTIKSVTELFNTNRCESLHSTIFNYAPKFSCWPRNFSAICHSATHSRTVGKGVATVKLARAIGIRVSSRSQMSIQLKQLDRRNKYHAKRKATSIYKQSRYFLRKRVSNRALFQDSLYAGQPSVSSQEHSYGLNY